jgi:hypothetical protein
MRLVEQPHAGIDRVAGGREQCGQAAAVLLQQPAGPVAEEAAQQAESIGLIVRQQGLSGAHAKSPG